MKAIDRYKKDVDALIARGERLRLAIRYETVPENMGPQGLTKEQIAALPSVTETYQSWYSEALALIKQILPDRADDFQSYYMPPKTRKDVKYENYTMFDYLKGLQSRWGDGVKTSAGITVLDQQFQIVRALRARFESSLFDIKALVQADLLDDELAAAEELNKNGFTRGAGAIAGVVIEAHLSEVCDRHQIQPKKTNASIADFNDALKGASVIEVSTWRFIQHLADIRNKCDHKKTVEPTKAEVADLIDGTRKITKTIF
ncbi:hypothetical protein BPNPMPFG_001263 [Mesorhizobium sp. AR07]|uniref:hypothetical protein n=1 Tax=Mesorhizobium sp. AR07 TaxID=2865838 RepID=UPI00215E6808|nr:hypothetical protein [Mesorhizobium sp. AR07]UVK45703.1 hypothetical protein BPNPMPFG_001263 [Mesorhizobium sp. AR07]